MRGECKLHAKGERGVRKIHVDTIGEYEGFHAAALRRGVSGVDRSFDEHMDAAMPEATRWRERDRC